MTNQYPPRWGTGDPPRRPATPFYKQAWFIITATLGTCALLFTGCIAMFAAAGTAPGGGGAAIDQAVSPSATEATIERSAETTMATTSTVTTTIPTTTTRAPATTKPAKVKVTSPPTTRRPRPATTRAPASDCHPSYSGACLHEGIGDYDCAGGSGNGPNYVSGPVRVRGSDPFDLDRDGDGWGCES
jgi:hypothetical protein